MLSLVGTVEVNGNVGVVGLEVAGDLARSVAPLVDAHSCQLRDLGGGEGLGWSFGTLVHRQLPARSGLRQALGEFGQVFFGPREMPVELFVEDGEWLWLCGRGCRGRRRFIDGVTGGGLVVASTGVPLADECGDLGVVLEPYQDGDPLAHLRSLR